MEAQNIKIKEAFDFFYLNEKHLTASQKDFINGLKKYFTRNKTLSENQEKALFEITRYISISEKPTRISMSVNDKER
jgi:hypothetical protein